MVRILSPSFAPMDLIVPDMGARISKEMLDSDMRGFNFIMDVIAKHGKPVILSSENAYGADRDRNEAIMAFRKKGIIVYQSPGRAATGRFPRGGPAYPGGYQ